MLIHPVFLEQFFPIACLLKSPLHTRLTHNVYHLVHTAQVNSRPSTYGRQGSAPHRPSTGYSKAPFWLAPLPGTYSASSSTQMKSRCLLVGIMLSHQVPMILLSPSRRTIIPCGHHQLWTTWLDVADNARCLVVSDVVLKNVVGFILSPVHVPCVLVAIIVPIILWIVWQAKVVYSTTLMSVMFSTHYALNKTKIFLKRNKYIDFTS